MQLIEKIKAFFEGIFNPYSRDMRKYRDKIFRDFEESETDEVV